MTPAAFADLKPLPSLYDVPTRLTVPNPSGRLRRIAFRINLSCWVIRCAVAFIDRFTRARRKAESFCLNTVFDARKRITRTGPTKKRRRGERG